VSLFYRGKHRRPPRFRWGRITAIALLVAAVGTSLAVRITGERDAPPDSRARPSPVVAGPALGDLPDRPDVYYIVFDTYGGETSLREHFGYDNAPFLRQLEQRGFYVARNSTTNYPRSLPSLASSLNMGYLTPLTEELGRDYGDTTPLEAMLDNHLVGRRFRSRGYRWIHIGSWWKTTKASSVADESIVYDGDASLPDKLFGRRLVPASDSVGYRVMAYERILFQFSELSKLARKRGPTFVFAHVLCPHGPNVMDSEGHYRNRREADSRGRKGAYLDQVAAMNTLILGLVDELLDRPAARRPIVIIQADEGPYEGDPSRWEQFDPVQAVRKFPILNAYHLPGAPKLPYPTISPVNTFRFVFDLYFGRNLPLLPDRNFTFRDTDHLYDLTEVTDEVRNLVLAPPSSPTPTASPSR
jgi:hypothetical protein